MMEFEKITKVQEGLRDIRFILKGKLGAVQFAMYPYCAFHKGPAPLDLGYHSPLPLYDGQSIQEDYCEYTGGKCYYDGSTLNAEPYVRTLIEEGSEAIWEKLEGYYRQVFSENPEIDRGFGEKIKRIETALGLKQENKQ